MFETPEIYFAYFCLTVPQYGTIPCITERHHLIGGTRSRSWLRHSATSRKVAGSIPDGVTGIFH
jgi:hypothetical protein